MEYVEVTVRVFKNRYIETTEIVKKPEAGAAMDEDAVTELLGEIEDLLTAEL